MMSLTRLYFGRKNEIWLILEGLVAHLAEVIQSGSSRCHNMVMRIKL